jgi:hypothetical protein
MLPWLIVGLSAGIFRTSCTGKLPLLLLLLLLAAAGAAASGVAAAAAALGAELLLTSVRAQGAACTPTASHQG